MLTVKRAPETCGMAAVGESLPQQMRGLAMHILYSALAEGDGVSKAVCSAVVGAEHLVLLLPHSGGCVIFVSPLPIRQSALPVLRLCPPPHLTRKLSIADRLHLLPTRVS